MPEGGASISDPTANSTAQTDSTEESTTHPAARPTTHPTASAAPPLRGTAGRTGLLVTFLLGGLTATPPLAMDMYLPALPEVTRSLHAPAATVQLTLTTCLAGMALGQLVVGPMSDRWGRRRPLLIGLAVYVVATVLCAFAPTVGLLVAFRLLQGLAGAAAIVIARAVVRDLYDGVAMARFFSNLMLISGLAPIMAPLIGGQILRVTDWRGVFVVLAVLGVLLAALVWAKLPETLAPADRHGGGVGAALDAMRRLLADRVFAGYMLTGGFAFASLFAYVAASPFVVQEIYGASPQTFSLLFGLNSIGLMIVGQINGKVLVGRVRLDRVLGFGLCVVVVAAVALLLMSLGVFGEVGLVPVAAALFVLMSAMGITMPNTQTLALMRTRQAAGAASALLGTASFLVGAIASPLVGIAGEDTAVPMAVVQLTAALAALACFTGLCRPWRGRASAEGEGF
ncbi:Bcr/CflA family drug resistance efflux transporter [Streptomyces sp. NWU339]|uniref:multidrug effflux MFS transporter n=1 Tax=Streptomyces sp. NWU339 TaxID=2185284 RepID=UPI000D67F469|nr:multidrug effflux MFS transporter [Streptomyces sp. NWU339]PWI05535.1 Bcr/CflA family drug resistance efflux transporter [Streptomyces sp. NWU339]